MTSTANRSLDIPTLTLPEFLLHHTWSIRCISSFAIPLQLQQQQPQQPPTRQRKAKKSASGNGCQTIEDDLTNAVRRHLAVTATSRLEEDDDEEGIMEARGNDEGTFVRLYWGKSSPSVEETANQTAMDNDEEEDNDSDDSTEQPSGKKRKLNDTNDKDNGNLSVGNQHNSQNNCHLLIDVTVCDEPSAQVACCFAEFANNDNNNDKNNDAIEDPTKNDDNNHHQQSIQRFGFLLTRGSKRSIEAVLHFLETTTKCRVAKAVFQPSVVDMTLAVTWWTSQHWRLSQAQQQESKKKSKGGNGNSSSAQQEVATTKPLTLTYAVPPSLVSSGNNNNGDAAGSGLPLESLSLMVPPVALLRLCNDIVSFRPNQQDPSSSGSTNANATTTKGEGESMPLVLALEHFLRETFRIRIDKFSLTNASCSVAVLGRDGRCKPICAPLLDMVLQEVQDMIERGGGGSNNTDDNEEDGEEATTSDRG